MRRISNSVLILNSKPGESNITGLYQIAGKYELGSMFSYAGEVFMCVDSNASNSILCSISRDHSLEALYKMENEKLQSLISTLEGKIPDSVEGVNEDVGD